MPNQVVAVPFGYIAEAINGQVLVDANGIPVQSFNLGSNGYGVLEIKSGEGTASQNQSIAFPTIQNGLAVGVGTNASDAGLVGAISSTPVIVLRKLKNR